jgi:hypothetical protein
MERDRPSHDHPTAGVTNQQFSRHFRLVALSFWPGKMWRNFQNFTISIFYFLN